ncbi:MAG TPA: branched-chain amino acid ABC transporter permease [Candidatus Caldiarchaeum subterraneum]|uniref:Branched-chain amino acid ABC transporter permease n=1 Tax=Caldiarchaeum subterraneum TaxID=311458 RepID=A0A832ZVX5_CALS0|nr:branched-chain amino acid ABC transporter permease [Candidatus Caldarchaeum subterraneum]
MAFEQVISFLLSASILGLASGTIYGVIALGFVLLYRVGKIVNIAVGDMVLIGAYLILFYSELGLVPNPLFNLLLSLGLAALTTVILAFFTERFLIRPLYGQSILSLIMMTVALALILRGITISRWGTQLKIFPGQHEIFPAVPLELGYIKLPYVMVWSMLGAVILFGFFFYIFKRTLFGFAMRAVSLEPEAAATHGISIRKIYTYSWIIAYVAAVLGGLIMGVINGLTVNISVIGLTKALPAALIGGIDSPGGAVLGGLLLGLIESTIGTYLNPIIPGIREVMPFIILLIVLVFRPYGLFGTRRIERV